MKADLYRQVTDSIIAQLEAGVQPWFKPWSVAGMADISRPLRGNGEGYRGINVLLLWAAAMDNGFLSPYWLTYRQTAQLGAQVRKGEDVEHKVPFLKTYKVFNGSQIDGLPDTFNVRSVDVATFDNRRMAKAEAFIKGTGADIRHGGHRAFYNRREDFIQMPDFDRFQDEKYYYSTLLHELGHYCGSENRLNRRFDGSGRFGGEGYAMEELVCELTACFLAADLGLYVEPRADHASYLDAWLKALKADKRAIFTAARSKPPITCMACRRKPCRKPLERGRLRTMTKLLGSILLALPLLVAPVCEASADPTGVTILYSPGRNLEVEDIRLIESARIGIDMAAYTLTSFAIMDALADAGWRGVGVRLLLDASPDEGFCA